MQNMNAILVACFTITLVLGIGANAATIYKCEDENGRVVFSQQRCAGDAEKIDVEPVAPIYDGDSGASSNAVDYQAITDRVANRMVNVKIRNAQNRIRALAEERDDKILAYRQEMMRSAYNAAGVSRNQKYQALINATRESYDSRIAAKQAEISALQRQLRR